MKQHSSSYERGTPVGLRVLDAPQMVATIKLFREMTGLPLGEIRRSISQQGLIIVGALFALDHDELEPQLFQFLNHLDQLEAKYEVLIDGALESRDYLNNLIERWHDIGIQTQIMTDLELGKPDIKTLEQMKERWSKDVFRVTLEQIAQGDGYEVDEETLIWIKRELGG